MQHGLLTQLVARDCNCMTSLLRHPPQNRARFVALPAAGAAARAAMSATSVLMATPPQTCFNIRGFSTL